MREPNPFREDQTLTIVESAPASPEPGADVRAIRIVHAPGGKAPPQNQGIEAVLRQLSSPEHVEFFEVDYDSQLRKLPKLTRFRKLVTASIAGGRVADYDMLSQVTTLRKLLLVSWKEETLEAFAALRLDSFRTIRGRTRVFNVSARWVLLQSCSKLAEFAPVRIKTLLLEGCHRVELVSLGRISGLRTLHILGRKHLPSLDFLSGCPDLSELVITATPLSRTDLSALERMPSLRKVFLAASDAAIENVASKLDAVVSNGDVCFVRGVRQRDTSAYDRA